MIQGAKQTGDKWRDFYQTPPEILERVGMVLGELYFDAAPVNPTTNELHERWPSQTYINPPFSEYQTWVDYGLQFPPAQIWMCHNNTERPWFQQLIDASTAICFPNQRIKFIDPRTGKPGENPRQGQAIFYRGNDFQAFCASFHPLGSVIVL